MENCVHRITTMILERNPLHEHFLDTSIQSMTAAELEVFEWYVSYCLDRGLSLEFLADSYDLFIRDTMKEQMYFSRHKRYRHSCYKEVEQLVYLRAPYMKQYMYGLAISTFLWPNHRQMNRFFETTLPRGTGGRYLEVGPGHGFFLMRAMRLTSYDHYQAVDISPSSVELTQALIQAQQFDPPKKCHIHLANFLDFEEADPFDALVLGEVLEHVENPAHFLAKVAALAKTASYIYVSTCLNAPEIDHISLFSNMQQLGDLFASARLAICEQLIMPYPGVSIEKAEANSLAINVAFRLRKA
jgi:2-polyprenyl-3-methyl-5-hydroxy-6-metoxy-1,4-benzoquinol methylase